MTNEKKIDMRGRPCPEPVVETRRVLGLPGIERLFVLVDNEDSAENVKRMAAGMGFAIEIRKESGQDRTVVITRADMSAPASPNLESSGSACRIAEVPLRVAVLIASATIGEGAAELGDILMRSFIKTLAQLTPVPAHIIFMNSGVRLTTEGSVLIDDLKALKAQGAMVLSCGTCLDYYHLKEKLLVGRVSNMYEIVTVLTSAERLLRP